MKMGKEEEDDLLPDKDAAKGFYAKYEPKEILGRWVSAACSQASMATHFQQIRQETRVMNRIPANIVCHRRWDWKPTATARMCAARAVTTLKCTS